MSPLKARTVIRVYYHDPNQPPSEYECSLRESTGRQLARKCSELYAPTDVRSVVALSYSGYDGRAPRVIQSMIKNGPMHR